MQIGRILCRSVPCKYHADILDQLWPVYAPASRLCHNPCRMLVSSHPVLGHINSYQTEDTVLTEWIHMNNQNAVTSCILVKPYKGECHVSVSHALLDVRQLISSFMLVLYTKSESVGSGLTCLQNSFAHFSCLLVFFCFFNCFFILLKQVLSYSLKIRVARM